MGAAEANPFPYLSNGIEIVVFTRIAWIYSILSGSSGPHQEQLNLRISRYQAASEGRSWLEEAGKLTGTLYKGDRVSSRKPY